MRKLWRKNGVFRTGGFDANVLLLSCCYALGVLAGYFAYSFFGFCLSIKTVPQWSEFVAYVWYYVKYLLLAFVCGYTTLGILVQPAILIAKGFFMCSAVVSAVITLSKSDALNVLSGNALISIVSLVCLFILSTRGLQGAKNAFSVMTHRRVSYAEPGFATRQIVRFLICVAAVAVAGALNIIMDPYFAAIAIK